MTYEHVVLSTRLELMRGQINIHIKFGTDIVFRFGDVIGFSRFYRKVPKRDTVGVLNMRYIY